MKSANPVTQVPWTPTELKGFWAMVKLAGVTMPRLRDIMLDNFGTNHLPSLTRAEWLVLHHSLTELCRPLRRAALAPKDPAHGRANEDQWSRIRWLQGLLGWNDEHRDNYIKKHGHIDSVRFMTVPIGRAIITGMEKILAWKENKEIQGGNHETD